MLYYILPALSLLVTGCDPTVQSVQENDKHYSIFGYLDAAADTQYIRVEKLRDDRPAGAPASLDADVRLTNLDTGAALSLRDSLFQFYGDVRAHNVYTTDKISAETTYRLVVETPDGETSRAEATVPKRPQTTVIVPVQECFPNCESPWLGPPCESGSNGSDREAVVLVSNARRLIAVKGKFEMAVPAGTWTYNHLERTVPVGDGDLQARVPYDEDWCRIPPPASGDRVSKRIQMIVAVGGPNWPDFSALPTGIEQLPNTASNVTGGVGLFSGIVTDTVLVHPYRQSL